MILFTVIISIGLLSYYIIFSRIRISSFDIKNNDFNEPVSIIICAKNEIDNINKFFEYWINQKYSKFEVIIVNDQSTDGSYEYLTKLAQEYSNLNVIHISSKENKNLKGKRYALRKGIEASKFNYVLFTDADCKPLTENWITEMTKAFFNPKTEIVLGYGPYKKEKGFLNKLIQFETTLTALQYFGFAELRMPYMSVGRNVAYKKEILTAQIFEKSNKSVGGDDDLILQQLVTKNNTEYTLTEESFTESIPSKTFKEWFLQKKRHLSAGNHYNLKFRFILGLFYILNISFISVLLIYSSIYTKYSALFFIPILLIISIIMRRNSLFWNSNILQTIEYLIINIVYWFIYTIFVTVLLL